MVLYEWKKVEQGIYPQRVTPSIITLPQQTFLTISGQGDPNTSPTFAEDVATLYGLSYAIKMAPKKGIDFPDAIDYRVYPLEGDWSLPANFQGDQLDKTQFLYTIMIKQPAFVTQAVFAKAMQLVADKVTPEQLAKVTWQQTAGEQVAQIMHIGSFDDEAASFVKLASWLQTKGFQRTSKNHHEIYLSDFRKSAPERLKTILRVAVQKGEG